MSDELAVEQILGVLVEGIDGPQHTYSYFLDHGPDAGLRNTLATVSATEASTPVGGNTIAAHAHHLVFSARVVGMFIAGERRKHDWSESWRITAVDDEEWIALRNEVVSSYESLRDTVRAHATDDALAMGGAVGVAAHLAYHVGAIRQKISTLRSAE